MYGCIALNETKVLSPVQPSSSLSTDWGKGKEEDLEKEKKGVATLDSVEKQEREFVLHGSESVWKQAVCDTRPNRLNHAVVYERAAFLLQAAMSSDSQGRSAIKAIQVSGHFIIRMFCTY